jgi:hypothetical protein
MQRFAQLAQFGSSLISSRQGLVVAIASSLPRPLHHAPCTARLPGLSEAINAVVAAKDPAKNCEGSKFVFGFQLLVFYGLILREAGEAVHYGCQNTSKMSNHISEDSIAAFQKVPVQYFEF